jgi:hypothetical protein
MTAEQPSFRQILRDIGRLIAGNKATPANDPGTSGDQGIAQTTSEEGPEKGPGKGLGHALGKTPIVAKLTTPLGKTQRNNFLVMALLALDVVLGATFGLVGYFGLQSDTIALTGTAMATAGLLLMLLFQLFGRER